jgi:transposase
VGLDFFALFAYRFFLGFCSFAFNLGRLTKPRSRYDWGKAKQLVSDELWKAIEPLFPPTGDKTKGGRPRRRPEKLHADKAYNSRHNHQILRQRGIRPRIAREGIESSERLGKHRRVVERTFAGLNRYGRLRVRFERRADIDQAFLTLGCALICLNFINRFC